MNDHSHNTESVTRDVTQGATKNVTEGVTDSATESAEPFDRGIVSFVRRGGRLSPKLQKAWDECGSRFLLDLPRDPHGRNLSVDPTFVFDDNYVRQQWGNTHPLIVEVGTGQGENIAAAAAAHPEINFLALEVFPQGIAHLLHRLGEAGTTNVRIGEVNAPLLFANNFTDGLLSEVWVWFPDPWPKMKHYKRRIIQPAFVADVHRCLKPGSLLRIATDIDDYALHVHEVLDHADGWKNCGTKSVSLAIEHVGKGDADMAVLMPHALFTESARFDGRVVTSFEKKGFAKGHTIHDFTYQAVAVEKREAGETN